MLNDLTIGKNIRSFSLSAENPTGEKGNGGRASDGTGAYFARDLGTGWKVNPCIKLPAKSKTVFAEIKGQGAVKHFWMVDSTGTGRQLILRIYFDGQERPAVEAPLSDFFCSADSRDFRRLTSMAMCVNPKKGMNCYFEMPYFKGFKFEMENLSDDCMFYYQIDCEEKEIPAESLWFHAQFRRVNPLPYKQDYVILDNIKGKGHYVGTYLHWGVKSNGWWGEGEMKFYIDGDKEYPSICGTGTEDYFCGAYNFDVDGKYMEFCTPYAGMHKVGYTDETYKAQRYFDMYRWHITDPVYFKEDLKVTIQALGWRGGQRYLPLQDDISSVAYWYSDNLNDIYPEFPDADQLEIV